MTAWYLSLDVGTTSVKAAAIAEDGREIATARAGYPTQRPFPRWVEHDPSDWWRSTCEAVCALLAHDGVVTEAVRGVGLSGMAATHVLLDEADRVVRPAILWQDTRATDEAAELVERLGAGRIRRAFAAELSLTASAQAARMLWLARHEPDRWARTACVLGAKDYLAWRLTGEKASDPTSVSGFASLIDGTLDPAMAEATQTDPARLPPIRAPHEVMGRVCRHGAEATGLPAGTPVVTGMMDSWCAMLGSGVRQAGDAFDTAGTAEVVGLAGTRATGLRSAAAIYRLPFLTGVDVIYGVTQCGTDALTWFVERFAPADADARRGRSQGAGGAYAALNERAAAIPPGSEGVLFLPYLEGERSPFSDVLARGAFLGVHRRHSEAHFARSVLEGVAFSVRHVLEACEHEAEARAERVIVAGGGAGSQLWNRIKADVLGRPLVPTRVRDAGSVGAAVLARAGVDELDLGSAVDTMVAFATPIEPNANDSVRYDTLYDLYREAGTAVANVHAKLANHAAPRGGP